LKIETFVIEPIQENCYVYYDDESRECVAIDPGGEEHRVADFIDRKNLTLKAILLTHGHFDHFMGAEALRDKFDAPVIAFAAEAEMLADSAKNYSYVGAGRSFKIVPDKLLNDGDEIEFGGGVLKTIHTPGHSKGGVCYYSEKDKTLFSGDTLFALSIGRTDLYGGDGSALFNSVKNRLFVLPGDVTAYPGHGEPTTIGFESTNNPFFRR
jgi:glyoxylase-like metal-dependent hydrolase (beta-lactamase superfamily II)